MLPMSRLLQFINSYNNMVIKYFIPFSNLLYRQSKLLANARLRLLMQGQD